MLPKIKKPLKVYVQFSANEQGAIDSVRVIRGCGKTFDNEAKRVVNAIPEWDVFYRRGKHERQFFTVIIVFSEANRQKYRKID